MAVIADNIARVRAEIAEHADGRSVDLMLAAKHQPIEALIEAINAGGTLMGHNMVQQLVAAGDGLRERGFADAVTTTVIGHVQSNKLSTAMEYADRIDTVDSLKTAQRIARRQEARIEEGAATGPYPVLIQVNSSGADSQFGCEPSELINLARAIMQLETVRIDGLMTIGAQGDEAFIRDSFSLTRKLAHELRALDGLEDAQVLSMGMSGDMGIAIEEGSTLIRVGTAIFGARDRK